MEKIKPKVTNSTIERIVREQLGELPTRITQISSGLIAATFECLASARPIIVQFNDPIMAPGSRNERFLKERLQLAGVPVREIIAEGDDSDLRYTISTKAVGRELNTLTPDDFKAALPSVFKTLSNLESVHIADTTGYGWLNKHGNGTFPTWKDHLLQIRDEEPGMFYDRWPILFESTFLERDRFDKYYDWMKGLLDWISPPRSLVHGGFGYNNVLVDEGQVTVLLDWGDTRYGDALFDLAYMDFWPSGFDLIDKYEEYYTSIGIKRDRYRDRILCYKYYTALDSMRFFAKKNDKAAYDATIKTLESL